MNSNAASQPTDFSAIFRHAHNRPRLGEHGVTGVVFGAVLLQAVQADLCSDEHFSVDVSLIESYASITSFRRKNELTTEAICTAEYSVALTMLDRLKTRHGLSTKTHGAAKSFDSGPFSVELEQQNIKLHCFLVDHAAPQPQNICKHRRAQVAARERMKERVEILGYHISQKCRKKVEEFLGWMTTSDDPARGRWPSQLKTNCVTASPDSCTSCPASASSYSDALQLHSSRLWLSRPSM
ncbi:MAG: hypothetical protein R3C18_12205 [Planctomycetaceae bacterium]